MKVTPTTAAQDTLETDGIDNLDLTDMDLERLPSGKFDTNFLVCAMAAVAMNILRLIGQNALIGKDAPLRHAAKRRRMKTVMQDIMFKAGRMIKHAGRWVLGLGANDSAHAVFDWYLIFFSDSNRTLLELINVLRKTLLQYSLLRKLKKTDFLHRKIIIWLNFLYLKTWYFHYRGFFLLNFGHSIRI